MWASAIHPPTHSSTHCLCTVPVLMMLLLCSFVVQCPMPCVCPLASSSSMTADGGGDAGHPQLRCKGGVSIVRDGCGCCFVCARQQGDLCDFRNRCDEDKLMRCDYTSSSLTTMSATSAAESTGAGRGRWAGGGGTDGDGGDGAAVAAAARPLPPRGICRGSLSLFVRRCYSE